MNPEPTLYSDTGTAGRQKHLMTLDWLAQLTTHIPNRREQMCRYYGHYSNKAKGMRKKAGTDDHVPALMESGMFFLFHPAGPAHNIEYLSLLLKLDKKDNS